MSESRWWVYIRNKGSNGPYECYSFIDHPGNFQTYLEGLARDLGRDLDGIIAEEKLPERHPKYNEKHITHLEYRDSETGDCLLCGAIDWEPAMAEECPYVAVKRERLRDLAKWAKEFDDWGNEEADDSDD